MNDLVKEYMETGKDLDAILKDRIKANNRQWVLITMLFAIIWIGHSVIQYKRVNYWKQQHSQCDSIHKVDSLTIDMQYKTLNSAVYFEDIK